MPRHSTSAHCVFLVDYDARCLSRKEPRDGGGQDHQDQGLQLEGNLEVTDSEYVLHHICYYCFVFIIYTLNIVGTPTIALACSLPLPSTVEEFLKQLKLQHY